MWSQVQNNWFHERKPGCTFWKSHHDSKVSVSVCVCLRVGGGGVLGGADASFTCCQHVLTCHFVYSEKLARLHTYTQKKKWKPSSTQKVLLLILGVSLRFRAKPTTDKNPLLPACVCTGGGLSLGVQTFPFQANITNRQENLCNFQQENLHSPVIIQKILNARFHRMCFSSVLVLTDETFNRFNSAEISVNDIFFHSLRFRSVVITHFLKALKTYLDS